MTTNIDIHCKWFEVILNSQLIFIFEDDFKTIEFCYWCEGILVDNVQIH